MVNGMAPEFWAFLDYKSVYDNCMHFQAYIFDWSFKMKAGIRESQNVRSVSRNLIILIIERCQHLSYFMRSASLACLAMTLGRKAQARPLDLFELSDLSR